MVAQPVDWLLLVVVDCRFFLVQHQLSKKSNAKSMTLFHPPLPNDLVTFNVRGRIFQTTLTTLRRFEDSILYKMVQYEQQRLKSTPAETSSPEAFFVDRDPDHFAAILLYH